MRYWEISEHIELPKAMVSWLATEERYFDTAPVVAVIADYEVKERGDKFGAFSGDTLVGYAEVTGLRGNTQLKKFEISENLKGSGFAGEFYKFLLSRFGSMLSDIVMTTAAVKFTKKMLMRYPSGIIDTYTGKIYNLDDIGKEISGLGIVVMSPEKDTGSSDRNLANRPVERTPEDYRFFWIISENPMSYEVL